MRRRLPNVIFLIAIFLASTAQAQDRKGWLIAAGIGQSEIRDRDSTSTFSGDSFGFSIEVEYRFARYFALGLNGFNLGEADDTLNSIETTIDVRGFGYFGRLILPVAEDVEIYGRLGEVNYYANVEPGISTALFGESALEVGAGIDFAGGERFSYRIEGRYFDGPRAESGSLVTAGVSYRF